MPRYLIREQDVQGYSPANHHGTVNRRLVSQANVGAQHMELVLGTLEKGGGALPHAHPGMEQACYLLEGSAEVEVQSQGQSERFAMQAGDTCFFPEDCMHVFRVTSDTPVRLLVFYSPPYGENPARVRRPE
ncbi:cupin domain-containing protein [Comamonas testosteroni]|uniref:cupin domain-containing protein n=1 Tax=Comamonas testosteroni TaxID=285 RepID=UPI00265F9BF6|nr:cupin domain-containing protein [Comamonas testosteroni]WKL15355.1 cupin domain-containing protein [Comamonas testosteroni]WQD41166.1 cupin domain-containing protein [Comamonas testosteroni]